MDKQWDVFISHSSEDKNDFVRILAEKLLKLGVKVWYDEFTLTYGDSLTKSIDYGLSKSDFGVVVISNNFLNKKWTDYEYQSLISKEEHGKKSILPIWHNISRDEVKNYSLYLADKLAITTEKNSIDKIALEICKIVRPDIIQNIKGYILMREILKEANPVEISRDQIKTQTKPQSKLSKSLICRAKNIHLGIGRHSKLTFDQSIYNYELDLRPDYEIQSWEMMNASYLEFIEKYKITDDHIKYDIFRVLLRFSVGDVPTKSFLSDEELFDLSNIWMSNVYEY
ncbi:toll/interleukin-1 receptor domain-containing protein [Elizabethkingia meningoseptica]|uniref:toll/interleukin-1 receptor domain-containing protein n=1 Tax=Elizabethkingia meningoseptica TaxID=238 RepID=UPI001C875095|nr:toll/interleukin-1 receptor domain-containing protein [Elizabethkingia meningoseptica]